MDIILYTLVNSPWFWISIAIWGLIAFASEKRKDFAKRILFLVSRPPVTKADPEKMHDNEGFYPGRILKFFASFLDDFKNFLKDKLSFMSDPNNRLIALIYFILLLCFSAFALADWIAIANGLSTFFNVDILLTPFVESAYGLAVGIATFLSLIIGFFVLNQARSDHPIMRWGIDQKRSSRRIAQYVSFIVVFISLLVGLFIGFQKLITLGFLASSSFIDFIAQFGVHVMILINGSLSASLIFQEAIHGFYVLAIAVGWIIIVILTVARHLIDFAIRLLIIVVDFVTYYIFTPVIGFIEFVKKLFSGIT